jgi:hypothetical protein
LSLAKQLTWVTFTLSAYLIALSESRPDSLPDPHLNALSNFINVYLALYVHTWPNHLNRFFSRSDFYLLTRHYTVLPDRIILPDLFPIALLPTRSYPATLPDFLTRSGYPLMYIPSSHPPPCNILWCNTAHVTFFLQLDAPHPLLCSRTTYRPHPSCLGWCPGQPPLLPQRQHATPLLHSNPHPKRNHVSLPSLFPYTSLSTTFGPHQISVGKSSPPLLHGECRPTHFPFDFVQLSSLLFTSLSRTGCWSSLSATTPILHRWNAVAMTCSTASPLSRLHSASPPPPPCPVGHPLVTGAPPADCAPPRPPMNGRQSCHHQHLVRGDCTGRAQRTVRRAWLGRLSRLGQHPGPQGLSSPL